MSVRINGGGASYPVNSSPTGQTTSARQQTTQKAGYSSASSFSGAEGATPEEVGQIRDSFAKYIDFSATAGGKPDTNSDPDHITLSMMSNVFGPVASDTRDRLCNEAKSQVDALLNQQPPLPKDQLDAKVKDIKDSLRQKMELESSLAKLMQDTQKKIKEATEETWGAKYQ
jgi:hypothetical protein